MDTWVGNQVDLELGKIDVQDTIVLLIFVVLLTLRLLFQPVHHVFIGGSYK